MAYRSATHGDLGYEIGQRGYALVSHGIEQEEIDSLIDRYTEFTTTHPDPTLETMDAMLVPSDMPLHKTLDDLDRRQDTQNQWHKYRTNVDSIGKPLGYTSRSFQVRALRQARGISWEDDPKEYYHFTPGHFERLASNHQRFRWGTIPSEVQRLDQAFAPIHHKAAGLMIKACGVIEETQPKIRTMITPRSLLQSPVRLLFYHPSTATLLAGGHYDKSDLTLGLAESHEGLRIAQSPFSEPLPVTRDAGKAVLFAGVGMKTIDGANAPYQPAWHDVIASAQLNQAQHIPLKAAEVCARWSIIFFANHTNFINPDKDTTHIQ